VKEDDMGKGYSKRNAYRILVGKSEGKRPLARTECRWKDTTEMDLIER
jgi:hypothetical protein